MLPTTDMVPSRRAWGTAAAMLIAGLAVGAAAMYPYAEGTPPPAAVAPAPRVAATSELMVALLDPAADGVWGAVAVIETAGGVEERRPRSDTEWLAVRTQALLVAEGARLLMTPAHARDQDRWLAAARQLVVAGAEAVHAAEKRDPQAVLDAGERIYAACVQCHSAYWSAGPAQIPPAPTP